ncbi:protocadherin Fat 4-like isoform X2 [Ptychodera flava]|uniref:protocadherin Fat 4-like isoform X2 n=1 Tax=Ptychodera flava TaxID=63121 RepID=UPI003969D31E
MAFELICYLFLCLALKYTFVISTPCSITFANASYSVAEKTASDSAIIPLPDITGDFPDGAASPKFVIASVTPGPTSLFDIDGTTGVLKVGSTVPDFETHPTTQTVDIQCKQITDVNGVESVTITITDDPEPCSISYTGGPFTVQENTNTGQIAIDVSNVVSQFYENQASPAFSITISPGADTSFDINPTTGALLVGATPPDFETDDAIQTITVTCHQESGRNGSTLVTVTIENVLENCSLTWSAQPFDVDENTASATAIISTADFSETYPEDKTAQPYDITAVSPGPSNLFTIDKTTGQISIGSEVPNYEDHGPTQTVTVTCYQATGNNHDQDVVININNLNEACSIGLASTSYSMAENTVSGSTIIPLSDITEDFPEGAASPKFVIVSVTPGPTSLFDIDGTTGVLEVGSTVPNFETHTTTQTVDIQCQQTTDVNGVESVTITITDDPEPCSISYTGGPFTVQENTNTGQIVIDASNVVSQFYESQASPAFSITISPGADTLFDINPTTGALLVGATPPDFETDDAIQTITVTCHQESGRNGSTLVTVTIENVLEICGITWTNAVYSVNENSTPNTPIIDATDVSGIFPETPASPKYGINRVEPGPADLFNILPNDGSITVGSIVPDFETHTPIQTIYVDCFQDPGLDGTYSVDVTINDVNEVAVIRNLPAAVRISESIGVPVTIFKVSYFDQEGDSVTVGIASQNPSTPAFTISDGNKVVTPAGLDYDLGNRIFTLDITVDDGTTTSVSSTLQINLLNELDETPSFGQVSYSGTVEDGAGYGTLVTWNGAADPKLDLSDDDVDDILSYYLTGTNAAHFNCDQQTGSISTANIVEADGPAAVGTYSLTISVVDLAGSSATADISITVNDTNDNYPTFNPSAVVSTIPENSAAGVTAAALTVSDLDSGAFGTVTLSIASGDGGKFALQGNDLVTTADPLDYETSDSYNIIIEAADGGGLTSIVTVIVYVSPVNEFAPAFTSFPSTAVTIPEDSSAGFVVLATADVAATDNDDGKDGDIQFSITSVTGGALGQFHMEATSGKITTLGTFDYESGTTSYTITCKVEDGGSPTPSSTTTTLVVNIGDVNDSGPVFDSSSYFVSVTEGSAINTAVKTFTINDADSVNFSYDFVSGNDLGKFKIDDATNQLQVNTVVDLDSGDPSDYIMIIRVKDGGLPELSGTSTVYVTVTSTNDHTPVFGSTTPATITISESDPIGTSVAVVNVVDDDYGSDGEMVLTIEDGDDFDNFRLDPQSGLIEIKSSVDFEDTGTPITLTIKASDGGTLVNTATQDVMITVMNVNDNMPTCNPMVYSISIDETLPVNSTVVLLDCEDLDQAGLSYRIKSGDVGNCFDIDNNGLIAVASSGCTLDYESGTVVYMMVIEVDDGDDLLDVEVTVNIQAVNEESPAFSSSSWTTNVGEDSSVGDVIISIASSVSDADTGGHGIVEYRINSVVPSSGTSKFFIDKYSGEIYLVQSLDFEDQTSYTLQVEAVDGGALTDTATITLNVDDVNDNSPVCLQSKYERNVNESTYPYLAVSVTELSCSDVDSGTFGTAGLTYMLVTQAPLSAFEVTGQGISLIADTLDYEGANTEYVLTLRVSDGGSPQLTFDVAITVTVDPVDDGPPSFLGPYSASVNESSPIGTTVEICAAVDPDSADTIDGQVTYSITSGDPDGFFRIQDTTGEVTTAKTFDAETMARFDLDITAVDGNGGSDIVVLTVVVADENDNTPECVNATFSINVDENTLPPVIYSLECSDSDQTDSSLNYAITAGDTSKFGVNVNGEIHLQAALDYDTGVPRRYDLEVTVEDSASNAFIVKGTVHVQPINEDVPDFVPTNLYSASVLEDVPVGTLVVAVSAQDADSADTADGIVEYAFDSSFNCPEFNIDRISGKVTTFQLLDFETASSYTLPIIAFDGNYTATGRVDVSITDVNDNPPSFSSYIYNGTVLEESSAGQLITTVTVTDPDSAVDSNNIIALTITGGDTLSVFAVDTATGDVTTTGPVDYDTTPNITLEITAADRNGSPGANKAKAYVIVNVEPVNEADPVFQSTPYMVNISESTLPGTSVFQVLATDSDYPAHPHGQVRYSITGGNAAGLFSIDEERGDVFVTGILDRETVDSYTLTITAADSTAVLGDSRSSATNLAVMIDDVNDNAPVCLSQPYSVSLSENTATGTTVMILTVVDGDTGANADFSIAIESGDPDVDFVLANDKVVVHKQLAYEVMPFYTLVASVTDLGYPAALSTQCPIYVSVSPENNHPPVFLTAADALALSESTAVGAVIYTASATDADGAGEHGDVSYTITNGNDMGNFIVDTYTGKVFLGKALDRETVDSFVLQITASDGNLSSQTTLNDTMELNITVLDENDNTPIFTQSVYETSIEENIALYSTVLSVAATDSDIGSNGAVTFKVSGIAGNGTFAVDTLTGDITTVDDIDREVKSFYGVNIEACDNGIPARCFSVVVKISIEDENDNYPEISPQNMTVGIPEDTGADVLVTLLTATDPDTGENGNVSFALADGDPLGQFYIDAYLGALYVSSTGLDREVQSEYILSINVSDHGTPSLATTGFVRVVLSDVNDNAPTINPDFYDISVEEDTVVGTVVCSIMATDLDANSNSELEFEIQSGNENGHFGIGSSSGTITVAQTLDVRLVDFYTLFISVQDGGTPSLTSQTTVNVTVIDVNDNAPEFTQEVFTYYVMENVPLSTSVGIVLATDLDFGLNSLLNFSFASGTNLNHFAIDATSGEITTAVPIDRESISSYTFKCKARDNGVPPRYNFTSVSVIVADENDNDPVFLEDLYEANVDENTAVGSFILSVSATDVDDGPNADITYAIPSSSSYGYQHFTIDGTTGEITVKKSPDYEMSKTIEFSVIAYDGGFPERTATATVWISVEDINDNAPKFFPSFYSAELAYSIYHPDSIVTVNASDEDANHTVRYFLDADSDPFQIDSSTGDIQLTEGTIVDGAYKYLLNVSATDDVSPTQESHCLVRIDTFNPSSHLVDFYMSISKPTFYNTELEFLEAITYITSEEFPAGRCGVSHVSLQDTSSTTSSLRKLLTTDESSVIVHVYGVEDNSTDSNEGLDLSKKIMSSSYLFGKFAYDSDGTPSQELQQAVFDKWKIEKVLLYAEDELPWWKIWWGMLLIGIICVVTVLLIIVMILVIYCFCCRKKSNSRKKTFEGRPTTSEDRRQLEETTSSGKERTVRPANPTQAIMMASRGPWGRLATTANQPHPNTNGFRNTSNGRRYARQAENADSDETVEQKERRWLSLQRKIETSLPREKSTKYLNSNNLEEF